MQLEAEARKWSVMVSKASASAKRSKMMVTVTTLTSTLWEAAGKSPDSIELVHYDPKKFDFGKKKAFPLRTQHFFASINKAITELNWQPKYDLISGLKDSFENDFIASGRDKVEVDFSVDNEILNSRF